jgi:hypothetical protein
MFNSQKSKRKWNRHAFGALILLEGLREHLGDLKQHHIHQAVAELFNSRNGI